MKSAIKIFSILSPADMRRCLWIFLGMLVGAILETVGIGAILPFIAIMGQKDWLIRHESIAQWAMLVGVSTHGQFIWACVGGLIFFYLLKNIYLAWQGKKQLNFTLECQAYYASHLYAIYLQKPYLYHLNHNTATLLKNTYDGPQRTFIGVLGSILGLLTECSTALVICGLLIYVDALAATVAAGTLGVIVYVILRISRKTVGLLGEKANQNAAVMHQWVNQGLGAIKETKVLGKEAYFFAAFDEACKKFCDSYCGYYFFTQVPRFMIEAVVVVGLLLLILIKMIRGELPEEIVPFLGMLALAAFRLMPCVTRSVTYINAIRFNSPLFNELYEDFRLICDYRKQGKDKTVFGKSHRKMPFFQEIRVNELSFHYPDTNKDVLADVSLVIPKGSFVGLVGPSGAGKTTFVDLLLGLLMPERGKILVDGCDIHEDIKAWQANLSYVPQSIYLIDGTIRENIALGLPEDEIDNQRVERVLRMAELYDFIDTLQDGMETVVGEQGVKLSGGQRQRVGIARALYVAPEVLVLDEATSALDDATEKSITDTILKLKGQLTIIAVAHRMTTLEDCDFKVRFENGRVLIES